MRVLVVSLILLCTSALADDVPFGCVRFSSRCSCFTDAGKPVTVSESFCRARVPAGAPIDLDRFEVTASAAPVVVPDNSFNLPIVPLSPGLKLGMFPLN